eukprot:3855516-Amphidinium_carterae.1
MDAASKRKVTKGLCTLRCHLRRWQRLLPISAVDPSLGSWLELKGELTNRWGVGCILCEATKKNGSFARFEVQGHPTGKGWLSRLKKHAVSNEHLEALKATVGEEALVASQTLPLKVSLLSVSSMSRNIVGRLVPSPQSYRASHACFLIHTTSHMLFVVLPHCRTSSCVSLASENFSCGAPTCSIGVDGMKKKKVIKMVKCLGEAFAGMEREFIRGCR